jgi:hypothetical protein
LTSVTKRWFTDPGVPALRAAISWLFESVEASTNLGGLLAIPGKDNLEGHIETVLGSSAVRELKKTNTLRLSKGTIELMTHNLGSSSFPGPVLAVFPTVRLLNKIDDLSGPTEILVVPWVPDEVQAWIQTWGALQLGSEVPPSPKEFSNPAVRAALERLTGRVNLSNGLAHPSDERAAIEMFHELHAAGEKFDPAEIRAWLMSELNWKPRHAEQVAEVAAGVLASKRFRL